MTNQYPFRNARRLLHSILLASFSASLLAAPVIAPKLATPLDIDHGEALWSELNCAACHAGGSRMNPRVGPVLGKDGLQLTPQFLRAFLSNPESEKPGTTMPDLLHGMSASQRTETVDALTHFLATVPDKDEKMIGSSVTRIAQGRKLFHTVGCVACHAPQDSWQTVMEVEPNTAIDPALLGANSIPLGNLAKKTTVPELTKFLLDPAKYRKSGRMPSLSLKEQEAQAIAMYLLRAQAGDPNSPNSEPKRLAGVQYEYFEMNFSGEPRSWDALKSANSGTTETFNLQNRKRDGQIGFRFTGLIEAPVSGKYDFWTSSDDGSRLYIRDKMVVDNGGEHGVVEKTGSIELSAGRHPITVTYYNAGGGFEFRVMWSGPGFKRQEIPASVLSHIGQPMLPLGNETFTRDAGKAEKGKALFASLGCVACHQHGEVPNSSPSAKAFQAMSARGGCLDSSVKNGLPDFKLDNTQRKALEKFVSSKNNRSMTADAQARHTLAALNCTACHTRDAKGGPLDARLQYFFANAEGDLGDEGRIPPHLTKVGGKLRRQWMTEVLEKGASVRPYMVTRMPQFGAEHVGHLPELFEKADGAVATTEGAVSPRDEKFGRRLVGTGGLSCISCHTFAGKKSLGIPAMDLAFMTKRLKRDWFERYLIDPAALRPGTRMPTFWPNGEAVNKDILEGKTDAQINALWAYLSRGRDADLPPGLVQGRKELVAEKEAIIYRNFIEGAGPRAIGVGYPEKANLAFDANLMRLAEIWQGSFIDAGRHSTGRGAGFEKPLGDRIYKMPAGPAFAILENSSAPWPSETNNPASYRMRGYRLDEKQRPLFLYSVHGIDVEDFPVAYESELDPYFKRTLKLKAKDGAKNLWFLAAAGAKIEPQSDGSYLVDERVSFKLTGVKPILRTSDGKTELLAPITFSDGEAQIFEEIRW